MQMVHQKKAHRDPQDDLNEQEDHGLGVSLSNKALVSLKKAGSRKLASDHHAEQ